MSGHWNNSLAHQTKIYHIITVQHNVARLEDQLGMAYISKEDNRLGPEILVQVPVIFEQKLGRNFRSPRWGNTGLKIAEVIEKK